MIRATSDSRDRPPVRSGRRSLLRLGAWTIGGVVGLFGSLYLWAWFSLDSSGVARAIIWMESDYDDPGRFPARVIEAGPAPYTYRTGPGYPEGIPADVLPGQPDLAAFLETTETTAFLVIRGDELIYERYFNGSAHEATQTSFSVAKSFASPSSATPSPTGSSGASTSRSPATSRSS
jgi:hypothetical protein